MSSDALSDRPAVAIIANAPTPYRTHFHVRLAREIPQIRLISIFTHETSNAPWAQQMPTEISPVLLGAGQSATESPLRTIAREWRKGASVIDLLRRQNVRMVVLYGYNDAGRIRVIRWCRRHGVPLFLWGDSNIRGDTSRGLKARVKSIALRRVLHWCRGAMCCGSLGRAYFEKYGVRPDRIYYVPYEPDYDLIQQTDDDAIAAARQRFGLDPHRRRVVFSGRLVEVKRADIAIDAFTAIAPERPDWDLLMIGDGPLRKALERRVPAALRSRVTWTGFLDDQPLVSALYRASDVLVLPSDYEPWALVINEAAAAGMAIVASDVVGAAAELVQDGVNGLRTPPGDLEAFTQALRQVTASDRIQRLRQGSASVLADWRRRADPVAGIREALIQSGLRLAQGR